MELYLHQKGHQVLQQSLKMKPSSSACHAAWKVCSCKCISQGKSRTRKGRQPDAKIAYGEHQRGAARERQATKPLRLTKEKSLAQLSRKRLTERRGQAGSARAMSSPEIRPTQRASGCKGRVIAI